MKKVMAVVLALVMCLGLFAACAEQPQQSQQPTSNGGNNNVNSGALDLSDARYQTAGKVVVATNAGRTTDTYTLLQNFNNYYPNIEVEFVYYETTTTEYLTAQSATGNMPDVIMDDADEVYYYISQGWVYPLNDFVKDDEDFSYVPESIVSSYTYLDTLYALPMHVHFNTVLINLDLLDQLNMDLPELDWSTDDYKEFLKDATNAQYSGTEVLWSVDEYMAGSMSEYGYYGFDLEAKKFHMAESWVDAVNLMVELRSYPGLEAWSLRNTSADIESSDYVAKFGNGDTSDNHMAFKMGKVLTDPRGTWDMNWLNTDLSFDWVLWPWPSDTTENGEGASLPMHVDCSLVMATAQDPQAAFEFVRYVTYSQEGNLERIAAYEIGDTDDYTLNNDYYIPATNHPTVEEKWKALEKVDEGVAFMYDNMKSSFRADLNKIVPGWSQVNDEYLSPRGNEVRDSIADAASVASELDILATKAIMTYWEDFAEKVEAVQEKFNGSH